MKKYILGLVFAVMVPFAIAHAATPTLTVSGTGDNNNVTVQVTGGEINAPVVLFYNASAGGNVQQLGIGTTDINGSFTGTVSTNAIGINFNSPVYVQVGGFQSQSVNWPYSATTTATSTAGALTFSPGSPNFSLGQSGTITISGGSGGYYISSNSNPNFTTASINGNTLTLSGTQQGTTNLTVCSFSGSCGVIPVSFGTVTATTTTTGSVTGATGSPTLSQGVVNISPGGQGSVVLSGGATPYTISVPAGSGLSTTLVGNTLYINNNNATGSNLIQVCSASTTFTTAAVCTPLTVNAQGQGQVATTTTGTGTGVAFMIPVAQGQTTQLSLSGGSGSYYLPSSVTSPVSATINGNVLTLTGTALGQTTFNVCSTGTGTTTTACVPVNVTVSSATFPNTGTGGGYFFENDLSMGMSGQDVLELQNRLMTEGYFKATPTGYFGPITEAAVRAYQTANGISAVGVVGPATRARLNQ